MREYPKFISKILMDPNTSTDYKNHNEIIKNLHKNSEMLLLVGHSQGNLFLNRAYQYYNKGIYDDHTIQGNYESKPYAIQAVHIAPPTSILNGNYILSDGDIVINALRVEGPTTIPVNNIHIERSMNDFTGHSLVDTYLTNLESKKRIHELILQSIKQLKPVHNHDSKDSFFQVVLELPSNNDLRGSPLSKLFIGAKNPLDSSFEFDSISERDLSMVSNSFGATAGSFCAIKDSGWPIPFDEYENYDPSMKKLFDSMLFRGSGIYTYAYKHIKTRTYDDIISNKPYDCSFENTKQAVINVYSMNSKELIPLPKIIYSKNITISPATCFPNQKETVFLNLSVVNDENNSGKHYLYINE